MRDFTKEDQRRLDAINKYCNTSDYVMVECLSYEEDNSKTVKLVFVKAPFKEKYKEFLNIVKEYLKQCRIGDVDYKFILEYFELEEFNSINREYLGGLLTYISTKTEYTFVDMFNHIYNSKSNVTNTFENDIEFKYFELENTFIIPASFLNALNKI